MKLTFTQDNASRKIVGKFILGPRYQGGGGMGHGGIIATLLDETMVWACVIQTKRFAYCAELKVRYVLPVRPGAPVIATAELVENRRGKIFTTQAELRDRAKVLLATASARYLPIPGEPTIEQLTDFVGDMGFVSGET